MCWIWCTVTVLTCSVGPIHTHWGFPHSSVSKESACNAGDPGSISGSGRSRGGENGNPLQYSCLENTMDRGTWQATVHGVARVRHDLVTKSPPYSLASNLVSHQISHSLMGPEMCPEPQASWLKSRYSIYIHTLNPASHTPIGWCTTVNDQVDTKFTLRLTPLLQILLPYPTYHLGCPQIPTTSCAKCKYHTLLDTAHRTARGHTQTTDQPMAQFACIHPQPTHILIHVAEVPACFIWVCLCFVRNPG